jgi:uncharacterized protein YfiM (DUF2279 family)
VRAALPVLLLALVLAAEVRAEPDPPLLRAVMLWDARAHTTTAPPPRRPLSEIDPWIAPDKALHAWAGVLITLSSQYVLTQKLDLRDRQAWPVAFGSAVAAGLAKEIMDSQRPRNPFFSWRDLAATAAGGAVGVVIIVI